MNRSARSGSRSPGHAGRRAANSDWREGTVREFLGLTDDEALLVRTKSALAVSLQRRCGMKGWSQTVLAQRLGSGQSRIAKMEAAHPSVSLDLLIRALLVTGATMSDIGAVVATGDPNAIAGSKQPRAKRARRSRRSAAAT